jgi:hypothetical protein
MLNQSFMHVASNSNRTRRMWIGVCLCLFLGLLMQFSTRVVAQSGITSPADGSEVSGDIAIFGTAVIDPFQKYELHYKLEPSGDDAFIYFTGDTTPVNSGRLGTWQAGALPPGTYSLRLRVVKIDGNYAEYYVRNIRLNQGANNRNTQNGEVTENDLTALPTPTSGEPTPTPIPTATFTPAPQPTPVVGEVAQPPLGGPSTPTPEAVAAVQPGQNSAQGTAGGDIAANLAPPGGSTQSLASVTSGGSTGTTSNVTRELGEALSVNRLRAQFFMGMRISAAIFLLALALYAGKRLFGWIWTQFS